MTDMSLNRRKPSSGLPAPRAQSPCTDASLFCHFHKSLLASETPRQTKKKDKALVWL